jgi:hypothetical protein
LLNAVICCSQLNTCGVLGLIRHKWIISHRCSWMTIYVSCCNAESKSHSDPLNMHVVFILSRTCLDSGAAQKRSRAAAYIRVISPRGDRAGQPLSQPVRRFPIDKTLHANIFDLFSHALHCGGCRQPFSAWLNKNRSLSLEGCMHKITLSCLRLS